VSYNVQFQNLCINEFLCYMQILLYLLEIIYMARSAKVVRSDKFYMASICTSGKYRTHNWIIFMDYSSYFLLYFPYVLKYMMNVSQVQSIL